MSRFQSKEAGTYWKVCWQGSLAVVGIFLIGNSIRRYFMGYQIGPGALGATKIQILSDLSTSLALHPKHFKRSQLVFFEGLLQSLKSVGKFHDCYVRIDYKQGSFSREVVACERFNRFRIDFLLRFLNKNVANSLAKDASFSFYIPNHDTASLPQEVMEQTNITEVPFLMVDATKVFANLAKSLGFSLWLVPDFHLIKKEFPARLAAMQKAALQNPFKSRQDVAFWRGSQTGGFYNLENKEQMLRYRLVDFSYKAPRLVDAHFVCHDCQVEDSASGAQYVAFMDARYGRNPKQQYFMSLQDHAKFKFLVSLDGNVSAWERVIYILNLGSVLLYNTEHQQFFTPYLTENVHYIEFKDDLSDLEQKIKELQANPAKAILLSEQAKELGRQLDYGLFVQVYKVICLHLAEFFEEDLKMRF